MLTRRQSIGYLLAAPAVLRLGGANPAAAQTASATFTLPPLPYGAAVLAPTIDQETMTLHHGKHHQAYVDALNRAVAADPALSGLTLEQLVAEAGRHPATVRNNAGGHWNHSFFWTLMAPEQERGSPTGPLLDAINTVYGSMEAFQTAFAQAGTGRFGSGWVWLIVNDQKQLEITSTPNQDNPLMDVADVKGTPILGNDVWEHAYYLTYRNRRADYLREWWNVVSWNAVAENYARALG